MPLPMRTLDAAELAEFRQSVRAAVSASDYPARVRDLEESGDGIDVDLWRLLAEDIGLAGLGLLVGRRLHYWHHFSALPVPPQGPHRIARRPLPVYHA